MKHFSIFIFSAALLASVLFSKDVKVAVKEQNSIIYNSEVYNIESSPVHQASNQSREQIDLIFEDFETTSGDWDPSTDGTNGWMTTTSTSNSAVTSYNCPDYYPMDVFGDTLYKSWDLFSPLYTLPQLGEGESMHFDFMINLDMPGSECNGDGYLDDYYGVSILDVESLAWHTSEFNAYDNSSWYCGFEDIGNGNPGYLDAWVQYLDTPAFTVPANGTMTADMTWDLESPAGAYVAGTCTDGWDQANVQISTDGGNTFSMLVSENDPYDFGCGYGMVFNGFDCQTAGDCPGWGGSSNGWNNHSFDLSAFSGDEVVVRFAFYSDPGFSTADLATITGFQVDNIQVSGDTFSDTGDDESEMEVSGAVWVDQFYDYYSIDDEDVRPGSFGWEQYTAGLPFNGNVFMDISDFAGKDVVFRFQTRMGEMTGDCGEGTGMFIDDFRVYKESGGSYPTPTGLMAESGDASVNLSWNDMNASGTSDFDYTNTDPLTGIQMSTTGSTAWAGERIDLVGPSTINTVSIHTGPNSPGVSTTMAIFGTLGSLYNNSPMYTQEVTLSETGWNDFDVNMDMNNSYIIAMMFTNVENDDMVDGVFAPLDDSAVPSTNSMVLFSGSSWDLWSVAGAAIGDGEWGIKANISYSGAGVTYSVYRDGDPASIAAGLTGSMHTDTGLENNQEYYYQLTATYSDGTESDYSNVVFVTPFADTVVELAEDDGTPESSFNAGSGKTQAVMFDACSEGAQLVRFKWYQTEDAGAFYIKIHADDNGMPGDELFSRVVASNVAGWNENDLSGDDLVLNGPFWAAIKEVSSTRPIGLDTSSNSGMSYENSSGEFTPMEGNAMIRVLMDAVNCSDSSCSAGDTNGDTNVDVLDIINVVNHIIGGNPLVGDGLCAADMNEDGNVDVTDIVSLVNVIIGG